MFGKITFRPKLLLGLSLLACLFVTMGCRRSAEKNDYANNPRAWFESATGLKVPETVTVTGSKCFTVGFVGDTYYIELSASLELEALLREHFIQEDAAITALDPPADWLKEMPFWRPGDLPSPIWFSKILPEEGEPEWSCAAAYDSAAGKCFFYGTQCR